MPKLVISSSTGPNDPTRSSLAFHIAANGAASAGVECAVILAGDATALLAPGVAESIRGVGIPPLADLLAKCRDGGVTIHVWRGCAEARGVSQLAEGMAWITPPQVVELVMSGERTLSF